MKKFDIALKNKIAKYRKNKMDISELIKDYSLKGEDVSGCVFKQLYRVNEDLSYCNFSNCIFEGEVHLSLSNISQCNFRDTVFKSKTILRNVNAQGANFENAFVPYVEYVGGDFRGVLFCSTIWRLGSRVGFRAKMNKEVFEMWGIDIVG